MLVAACFGAWFWATVVGNHPTHSFERIRQHADPWSTLLPNWRFFAPNPGQHDQALLYRVRDSQGAVSRWAYVLEPRERALWQAVVSPGKREAKSANDAITGLLRLVHKVPARLVVRLPQYRLLEAFVRRLVESRHASGERPQGFQFAIVRHTGYDEVPEPDYLMISPYVPMALS
jgi:hypothetical protein